MATRLNGRYGVVRSLGRGSDAEVFLARDADGGQLALKRLTGVAPGARARLAGEFRRLAALDHPNLVRVHDLEVVTTPTDGFSEGALFFTADHVEGVVATAAIAAAAEPLVVLLAMAEDLASALAHVHATGLVHSDVKPDNVLVRGGDRPRAVLLDLGLATARNLTGTARGTPAFMAPEALAGAVDPRSDLYGLGATLYAAATGHPPHGADDPATLVRAICDRDPPPIRDRAPWVPEEVADLVARLLSRDPFARPSSAGVVLDDIDRIREALDRPRRDRPRAHGSPASALLPPRPVGRDATIDALAQRLAELAAREAPAQLVRLIGPAGSGHRSVFDAALRRQQLEVAAGRAGPLTVARGDGDAIAATLGAAPTVSDEPRTAPVRWVDALLERAARVAERTPVLIVCEDSADERCAALARAVAAGHPTGADRAVLVVSFVEREIDDALPAEDGVVWLALPPLDVDQTRELVGSMIGRPPARDWAAELATVSGGLVDTIVEVVRLAHERGPLERTPPTGLVSEHGGASELLLRRATALGAERAAVLEATAVLGGSARAEDVAAVIERPVADVHETAGNLASAGLLERVGDRLRLVSAGHGRAIEQALPEARRKALHRRALSRLEEHPSPDPVAVARHLAVTGPAARAARACERAARLLAAGGRPREALRFASRAADTASGTARADARLLVAELAVAVGAYEAAIEAAAAASRSRDDGRRRRAQLMLARARQKAGQLDAAEALLAELAAAAPEDEEIAGTHARLLVARARYRAAADAAGDPVSLQPTDGPLPPGRALRLEAAGLARLYLGDADGAETAFERIERSARGPRARALRGRARGLLGMVSQTRGAIDRAAELYAAAAADARAASDVHAAAIYDLNQATAHSERGRFAAALDALDRARVELGRLGASGELAAALFNRGNALLGLGELTAARRAAADALAHARRVGTPHMEIYARLLEGDVLRRTGDIAGAADRYRRAVGLARESGRGRDLLLTLCNLAEARALQDDRRALELLDQAGELADTEDDRDRVLLARARVTLDLGTAPGDLAERLRETAERADAGGRLDQAWRAGVLAARILAASGNDRAARARAERARRIYEAIVADAPEARRAGLRDDPDARSLAAFEPETGPAPPPGEDGHAAEARLRRLLALGRRLNSELRLAPLLDDVIDTVIEMTAAERGFLLLFDERGRLEVVVARNFEQGTLGAEGLQVSRSIAEQAARSGQVVLTVDAAFDDRFGAAASVAALQLRSVLAVPLRQKGRVTGTIYVDHRFRRGAFDDGAVELVRELADVAAIAIENARLVEDNQRRQSEIAALNRRLRAEVEEKEVELATVKARFGPDERGALRHAYDSIVGRSPAMVDMLRVVDRAADTDLPVVIYGESGTGKELVARALHQNGPRREGPFVALNCGAVPEQLLESELFGHGRGAFTGADRDRRGLFEVADRGTLFLDEVADTGPAMQAKLLRALQEGEIRRVGDERPRRVDVRVIAASNRRLADRVASGVFREDLYYRLDVLHIDVPPLRERVEDIQDLARHVLARLADDGAAPRLTDEALARLCAYHWPGNVRELENELARAFAMGGDVIDTDALSSRITSAPPAAEAAVDALDDLRLRPRVESLERSLVEEAMRRTGGNQTAAAKVLGLSRYGLQKKLKRYGLSRT